MTSDQGPFKHLHHICIVVPDLNAAVAFLERLGVGPWEDYPPLDDYVRREVADEAAFLALRYRTAEVGGCQLQLVQPGSGSTPQADRLAAVGPSVFSIGFVTGDVDQADEQAGALGLEPLMRGRRQDGSGFTYFDTFGELGAALLLRKSPTGQERVADARPRESNRRGTAGLA